MNSAQSAFASLRHAALFRGPLFPLAGLALLIGVLVTGDMLARSGVLALNQIEIANQRGDHLDDLQKSLLDMETAERGYLLTFDPIFLRPYHAAAPRIPMAIRRIQDDYANDDAERARAATLVKYAQGVAESLEITTKQAEHGLPNRQGWLDHDKAVMDAYRMQHAELKSALYADNRRYVAQSVANFRYARIATVLLASASMVLLLLAFGLNRKQQVLRDRITRMLHQENEQLEREVRERTEELASLATYLTNVREEEKLHLARELHDEMGALLTAAKLDANWIERKLSAESMKPFAERLERLQQTLTAGITLKRRITNDLRPALLYDLGLIEALRVLAEEFARSEETAMEVDLPDSDLRLSDAAALSLFRIVQEGLTNIRKHAGARRVNLTLRAIPDALELVIQDDGAGFDSSSPKLARHGLAGIKHRVYALAGKLEIRSAPGAGTTIRVLVPH